MLERGISGPRVSTGFGPLDDVLGGLYWGDNVVWQFDGTPIEPFYQAIALQSEVFEAKFVVTLGDAINTYGVPGLTVIDPGPVPPGALLREIRRLCRRPARRLLLLESLDAMVRTWGVSGTREFLTRCCPMLLEVGTIAYWSMSARETPAELREAVAAVTQCVLHVDARSVQVVKAEARDDAVIGTVLHWHSDDGRPALAPPAIVDRIAASLRAIRHAHELSQHDLGHMAGVTASAISQVERAERGLSLATLVRLSTALGVTVDDLLQGEQPAYRIGRRTEDPRRGLEQTLTLLDGKGSDPHIDLVHLKPRESGRPAATPRGTGIVAVLAGLVQISVAGQTPAIRDGEVLVTASERIEGWRNLDHATDAIAFWIVSSTA